MFSFLNSLCSFDFSPLLDMELVKIFSHSVGCCFVLLTVSFALQKLFSFMRSHLLIVDFYASAIGVLHSKQPPVSVHSRLFPTFSSIRFNVSVFMFMSLIHLDLSFVLGDRGWVYLLSSACRHPVRPALFIEVTFFFPLCVFVIFIKNQVSLSVWIYVWVFNLILLINVSVFMLIVCSFYYYSSVGQPEIRDGDTSGNSIIVQYLF